MHFDDGDHRLFLRPCRVADAEAVVEAIHESLPELRAFFPWAHEPQTLEIQRARLTQMEALHRAGKTTIYHLYESEGAPLAGVIGMHRERMLNPLGFEVGFWTRTCFAGRGLMTLATQCLIVWGFEQFGANRVQCGYNEANAASQRVNQKIGFVEEGRMRFFNHRPTAEMFSAGCRMGEHTVMTALYPDVAKQFPWYAHVERHLTVSYPREDAAGSHAQT